MARRFKGNQNLKPTANGALIRAKLNDAVALHQQGQFEPAIGLYSDILRIEPRHFDAIHLLGVIADQMKNHQLAADLIAQAIAINPKNADAYFNRGNALKYLEQFDAAVASYDQAIKFNPGYTNAFLNRGIAQQMLGRLDAAVADYDRAVALKADLVDAHYNRGVAFQELNRFEDALASYQRVIALRPKHTTVHYNAGVALQKLRRFDEALASYDRALALNAGYTEAHCNRGLALYELRRFDEALASYDKALMLNADYAEAHCNRGAALEHFWRRDEALASYDTAIAINPDYSEAYSNRGTVLKDLGRLDEALASYERALALRPDYAKANWNKSLVLLLNGDYRNGWPSYEWRWHDENLSGKRLVTTMPRWAGADSGRVLVWSEQGIGDELMFGAMLPEMRALCSQLIVKLDKRLIPLLARSMPRDIMFVPSNECVDHVGYDAHIPMGSLGLHFRQDESSFGRTRDGYIFDDKERTDAIRAALRASNVSGRKKIGISWRSKNEKSGANRSLTLKAFVEMLSAPDADFVSLQYGDTGAEIEQVRTELGVNVLSCKDVDNFQDIDGLASLIQACDFVVSVDNSTVHLAGALGKDTRALLPFIPDWRWLRDRRDSPWYASVKLYRQDSRRDWSSVFTELNADLVQALA